MILLFLAIVFIGWAVFKGIMVPLGWWYNTRNEESDFSFLEFDARTETHDD